MTTCRSSLSGIQHTEVLKVQKSFHWSSVKHHPAPVHLAGIVRCEGGPRKLLQCDTRLGDRQTKTRTAYPASLVYCRNVANSRPRSAARQPSYALKVRRWKSRADCIAFLCPCANRNAANIRKRIGDHFKFPTVETNALTQTVSQTFYIRPDPTGEEWSNWLVVILILQAFRGLENGWLHTRESRGTEARVVLKESGFSPPVYTPPRTITHASLVLWLQISPD